MIARLSPGRAVRGDWAQAGLVALLLFCLYAATAPRTVALEDDGLFVLSSYFLGIEHPPGYPLYVLLGKLFTYLPVGSVAYRVHLLSALFGGLTCAMLWMCARTLLERRLPAYVAALALGLTPVFWSQALIAEVYTFNTLFFTALVYLGLRACPPGSDASAAARQPWLLPWMALVFGLSLSNHWPLMLLAAPALAVLIWPLRGELPRSFGNLIWLVVLGLLPYAWMVWRSWTPLPISFHGPLERVLEIWYFISREGYAHVDHAPSAGWLDRAKFFRFMLEQLFYQFAVIGTALAAAGFYVQWRLFGRRIAAALTLAFLMPSFVLVMLLGFDYDSVTKHMFHVYPLPAYAVAALWAGVGCTWLVERLRVSRAVALAGSGALIGLILALGSRSNLLANYDWAARYARAVLHTLPRDANLFVHGDADFSIAYFNMIENLRPDVTLYHSGGLVLGNRLFHPLRTPEAEAHAKVQQFILDAKSPVALTAQVFTAAGRRDRWLHHEVDRSSTDRNQVRIEISEEAVRFFEESVLDVDERNPWIAYHQDELRRRYAILLGERLRRGEPLDPRSARHLKALSEDFFGAMGLAEGLMANKAGYSAGAVADLLERARALMPADATKAQRSSFFFLRGLVRMDLGDRGGAVGDLETAVAIWSVPKNPAVAPLRDAYQHDGNAQALSALAVRVKAPAP
jgi:hypothetical protein